MKLDIPAHATPGDRHKLVEAVRVIADWCGPFGALGGREVLEFGCGEGTMALGIALQHSPARVVGVEVQGVHRYCLPLARENLGLTALPQCLHLEQIAPGQTLSHLGKFDVIFSWSVFEHVAQELLQSAFASIASALKPEGVFFLQISPLYYSAFGSHLQPWVAEPWAHLAMQNDAYETRFFGAPEASQEILDAWSIYIKNAPAAERQRLIWNTYQTLNKATASQLCRLATRAGLKIVRDYRTTSEFPIPEDLADIYDRDALLTEQIVWLLQQA